MIDLYGCKGCGSAVVEALLEWAGVPYTFHEVEPWQPGPAVDALAAINPLVQVPTLRLPDGTVMSESAAIILALAEAHPAARMLPHAGDPARMKALRWIAFIAGNLYPAISVGDFPERWVTDDAAQEMLKQGARERLQHYWSVMERSLAPAPYLVGHEMSAPRRVRGDAVPVAARPRVDRRALSACRGRARPRRAPAVRGAGLGTQFQVARNEMPSAANTHPHSREMLHDRAHCACRSTTADS